MERFARICFVLAAGLLPMVGSLSLPPKNATPYCECDPCVCQSCECVPATTTTQQVAVIEEVAIADTAPALTPVDEAVIDLVTTPLVVGSPPDTEFSPKESAEPPPGLIVPVATKTTTTTTKTSPAPVPVVTGYYRTVYAGFRGRRSYREWVPYNTSTAATVQAPTYQSPPTYYYNYGSCSSGRCR